MDFENEESWLVFSEELKERGVIEVQRVISDGHTGIQKAAETAFLGASWQRRAEMLTIFT